MDGGPLLAQELPVSDDDDRLQFFEVEVARPEGHDEVTQTDRSALRPPLFHPVRFTVGAASKTTQHHVTIQAPNDVTVTSVGLCN